MLERLDNRQRLAVRVLVERLAPYKWCAYDPCCGSVGMFMRRHRYPVEAPRIAELIQ